MKVEKITTKKISERVVEQIEHWVQSGTVQPGDKLPSVREMCDLFQVGRSAVRDALTTLKGRGIVDVRHGEGAFVCQPDAASIFNEWLLLGKKDIGDLYAVRQMLEIGSVELAAIKREGYDLLNMKRAIFDLENDPETKGWQADYEFHMAIARATRNEVLVQLMETLSAMMKKALIDCYRISSSDQEVAEMLFRQHMHLYEAIEQRKPLEAKERMRKHLSYVENLLQNSGMEVESQ